MRTPTFILPLSLLLACLLENGSAEEVVFFCEEVPETFSCDPDEEVCTNDQTSEPLACDFDETPRSEGGLTKICCAPGPDGWECNPCKPKPRRPPGTIGPEEPDPTGGTTSGGDGGSTTIIKV